MAITKVTRHNTPAWKAKRGSAQTGILDATSTTIVFDSEELDTDSAYDTSTGIFTLPSGKDGSYMVGGALRTNMSGAATRVSLSIDVEGTEVAQFNNDQSSNGEASTGVHAVVDLTAGDEVKLVFYQDSGGAVNAESANGKTYFYGYKIIT